MEHHKADMWQVAGRGMAGDDTVRFLRELRQLRDGAGLGHAELAARAHYPYDLIKAAEAGPSLPDLPVLSAYVRGCGGTAEEWEERWRTLTRTPSLPVSASRHAGNSDAASAGARIGATTQVVDAPDPSVIMAALNRVAEGMAGGDPDVDAAPLTVPAQPAFPGDDVSAPAAVPLAGVPIADAPPAAHIPLGDVSLGDVSPGDIPLGDVSPGDTSLGDVSPGDTSLGDVSPGDISLADVSLGDTALPDAFAAGAVADPLSVPADFSAFAPVAAADHPLAVPSDDLVDPAGGSPVGPAEPAAGDTPKGWDPIRVSAAWPAIGDEDPRGTRVTGDDAAPGYDIPPWGEAPAPASVTSSVKPEGPGSAPSGPGTAPDSPASSAAASAAAASAGAKRPGAGAPAEHGTRPVIRQSAWARGVDAFGEPTGVARPGSRARTLMVVIVLVCVLAVVLAIFA